MRVTQEVPGSLRPARTKTFQPQNIPEEASGFGADAVL